MRTEASEYLARAKREFLDLESVGVAKPFLEISPYMIGKEKTTAFLSLYWYARLIDNGVDSGKDPLKMKKIIRTDINRLQLVIDSGNLNSLVKFTDCEHEEDPDLRFRMNLLKIGLESVGEKRGIVSNCILESLKGTYLDNISMTTNRPLFDYLRPYRDKRMIYTYFEALSQVFFDRPLANDDKESILEEFFSWCLLYDAIDDVVEDVKTGTFSFTRKSMAESCVTLKVGEEVPDNFENLYNKEKSKLISDAKTILPKIFESNLPLLAKMAIYIRLKTQTSRVAKSPYTKSDTLIFGENRISEAQ